MADLAESGHPIHLESGPQKGGRILLLYTMAIAKEVARLYWDEGMTLEEACAKAGEASGFFSFGSSRSLDWQFAFR